MSNGYRAYVMDVSYFSGKLEAYLRYKQIPYERVEVGWRQLAREVAPHTGLMKVPALRTPEGEWLQDTTPMLDALEQRHPGHPIVPEDPLQAFCCRLLEDYADEWLWRPALHYRWSFRPDARLLSQRIATEVMHDLPGPRWLVAWQVRRRQHRVYVAGDGVAASTRAHVEGVYRASLERLERILAGRRYLLGDRPCLADFGFFASMFRHFSLDPTPARIMRERAPRVYAWVARLWNARAGEEKGEWCAPGALPEGWEALLCDVGEAYLPYLHANACAWREGRQRFEFPVQGVVYRDLPVVRYRVWCRERLQQHLAALGERAGPALRSLLERCGAWDPLQRDGCIASHLAEAGRPGRLARLRADPWNPTGR